MEGDDFIVALAKLDSVRLRSIFKSIANMLGVDETNTVRTVLDSPASPDTEPLVPRAPAHAAPLERASRTPCLPIASRDVPEPRAPHFPIATRDATELCAPHLPIAPCDTLAPQPRDDSPAMSVVGESESDSSSDEGFTLVTGKKRKINKSSGPSKAARVNNDIASVRAPAAKITKPIKASNPSAFRSGPPPPVIIPEKSAWERISLALKDKRINYTRASSTRDGIRVVVPTSSDHRDLTRYLREQSIGYHTYALEDEKRLRAVIKGLPKELSTELIKEDLLAQSLPVEEVHRMYRASTREPYDLVLVVLPLTREGKQIFNIKSICFLSGLTVEAPRKRGIPGQCHNCQLYGHSALRCFARPRCVKCLGDHATSNCERTKDAPTPPSCVLCGREGHPANYRGCPRAPQPKRKARKPLRAPAPRAQNAVVRPPPASYFPPLPTRQDDFSAVTRTEPTGTVVVPAQHSAAPPAPAPTRVVPRAPVAAPPTVPVRTQNAWARRSAPAPTAHSASDEIFAADLALVCRFANVFDAGAVTALATMLRDTEGCPEKRTALAIPFSGVISAIQKFRVSA